MKNLSILFLSIVLLMASCKTTKPLHTDIQTYRDTTIVKQTVTVRDTVIRLEPDKSALVALLRCDSTNKVIISNLISEIAGIRAIVPVVKIVENILVAECECDTAAIRLPVVDYYTQEISRIENLQTEKTVEIQKVKVRGFFWWTGMITVLLLIVYIAYKLFKRFYTK